MTSVVPVGDILQSAIAAADWVLSCLRARRKERFDEMFTQFMSLFQESRVDDEAFQLFLRMLPDVFESLAHALQKGSITVATGGAAATSDVVTKFDKLFSELLTDAEDFLTFLFVCANTLDKGNENHITQVFRVLSDIDSPSEVNASVSSLFPELRLKSMMTGFNLLKPNSPSRYSVCIDIIQFASKFDLFDYLVPHIDAMEDWAFNSSDVTTEQRITFLTLLCDNIRKSKDTKLQHCLLQCMIKLLKEYESTNLKRGSDTFVAARKSAVDLLKLAIDISEVVTFDDIIKFTPVQNLKGTEHEPLFELALLLYQGDHNDFEKFVSKHPNMFDTYDLDVVKCREKIQLFVLATMVTSLSESAFLTEQMKLPLQTAANKLGISEREAESLAVKAISLGIIDGLIDQLHGVITVRSALPRSFGPKQWKQLHTRLSDLRQNITEILGRLQESAIIAR